jgi:acid phosphatase type 7
VLVGTTVAPDTTLTDLEAGDVTRYVYTVVSTVGSQRSDPSSPIVATMPGFVAGDDAVIYAVGDIACKPTEQPTSTTCHHRATSDIAVAGAADAVLALGDLQYEKGQLNNFKNSYDPTWGRLKSITYPVPGNHEYYLDTTASGYDSYFLSTGSAPAETWNPAAPYYSFDLAGWHFVALNSNCTMPEAACGAGDDAQVQWLQQDLAANDGAVCTIGYWHHSRWSSSSTTARRDDPTTEPFWAALDAADADVVIAAHQHFYERFEPVAAGGGASASGLRSFISGAGGRNFDVAGTPRPTSEAIIDGTFGVLKLTLHDGSYDWSFVPEFGAAETDSGSAPCI